MKDFLTMFRQEYRIDPSNVIVMDTWADSTHVYFEGLVVEGNSGIPARRRTVSVYEEETSLYKTGRRKFTEDIGLGLEYDDQASFLICFHRNNTICNILSYEHSSMNGIPVLLQLEERYHIPTMENDPDLKDSYPFFVDNPARYDGDYYELSRKITKGINEMGISCDSPKRICVYIDVDKHGHAVVQGLGESSGNLDWDKKIIQYMEQAIAHENFIPATHRGGAVNFTLTLSVLLGVSGL